ncbi:Crp/Fnr family transcriptional regulator [Marinobacterium maritimum]|uniref:Crp/Fnr family transcriptional regulator n=1 Tax=Marinobacterium maritimum TaxID=500162 RepID=A0ABP3TCI9_9GAMM
MRTIPNLHDFVHLLPDAIQDEIRQLSVERNLRKGETLYCKGDPSIELYRVIEGAIKLCIYSRDGREHVVGELLPGDCLGEMGLMDGLPRGTNAVASRDSRISVLSKRNFDDLYNRHPVISQQLNVMLCRRLRVSFTLNEDNFGLRLRERLARVLHRLAYSHGHPDEQGRTCIKISHEALSKMVGASRQTVSTELKSFEREGSIRLQYGRILISDLKAFGDRYEAEAGIEQVSPSYGRQ